MVRSGFFGMALLLLVQAAAASAGQASAEIVGPTAQIPRGSFKTWSLFLICNPDWVAPEKSGDLVNLYRRFQGFADAIGSDNVAVWFWKRRTSIDDPRLAENVDVARSAEYCRALKLRPTAGPFLVVTSTFPELPAVAGDRAVFELGGLDAVSLAKLLNSLTDQLLLDGKVDATPPAPAPPAATSPPAAAAPASASLWIRLLEGARRSMIGFGCKLKMRVETGVLSAELRECAGP